MEKKMQNNTKEARRLNNIMCKLNDTIKNTSNSIIDINNRLANMCVQFRLTTIDILDNCVAMANNFEMMQISNDNFLSSVIPTMLLLQTSWCDFSNLIDANTQSITANYEAMFGHKELLEEWFSIYTDGLEGQKNSTKLLEADTRATLFNNLAKGVGLALDIAADAIGSDADTLKDIALIMVETSALAAKNGALATGLLLSTMGAAFPLVAASIVAGMLVYALTPRLAKGGVVDDTTIAMIGEGKYPEAVVPLGESPQFAEMKSEIANAVLQGINANNGMRGGNNRPLVIQFNVDGRQFAEATVNDIVDTLNNEGYNVLRSDAVYR